MMTIGERIKQKRLESGMTQMDLAKRMGYGSKAAICHVEKGDESNLTMDRLKAFANALGCTTSYLMGWEDEPYTDETDRLVFGMYMNADEQTKEMVRRVLRYNELINEQK